MTDFDPLTFNPERIAAELYKRGVAWADADAASHLLEETTKSVLAGVMVGLNAKSVAEAETRARASDEYRAHLQAASQARREANRARVRYDAFKAFIELVRTKAATVRSEMSLR